MHYRIGTRGSKLALVQSEYVKRRMEEAYPEDTFELVIIKTTGDKVTDKPLAAIGTKGLFVKEIEEEQATRGLQRCTYIKDCRKFFRTSFGCGYRYWEPQACMPACNAAS